jgi:ADP-ribose pyrophosphatase YjhB (NUDIX family)
MDDTTEIRTWRTDGELHRERIEYVGRERWISTQERIDGGLEWGVGAVVEVAGEILLVRQNNQWLLPGGKVEAEESHAEALVRELCEETGVNILPGERLAVVRNVVRHDDTEQSFQFAIYRAAATDTETTNSPGLAGEAIEAVAWMAELPQNTLDRDLLTQLRD